MKSESETLGTSDVQLRLQGQIRFGKAYRAEAEQWDFNYLGCQVALTLPPQHLAALAALHA